MIRLLVTFFLVATVCGLVGCHAGHRVQLLSVSPDSLDEPEVKRELRAVWVATVVNIDWPSEPGLDADTQRAEAIRILDLAAETNLNAVVLQIRPTADALYRSPLEPTSEFLTGEQGAPLEYDPLEFWVREAHARAIDVHAWFNPFRARHPGTKGPDAPSHVANIKPELVRSYNNHLWLDPGEPAAREHSLRVIEDVVSRYNIDGIHLDDYFYPYPTEEAFPDDRSYLAFQEAGGTLSRDDWRRDNINRFMHDLHTRVKAARPEVLVGISPFGIYRPNFPEGVQGFDQYARLYADARRWLRAGWLDYIAPQLYWKIDSAGQPFEPLLDWWSSETWAGKHVWPGLYLTRIKADEGWTPDEIIDQVRIVRDHPVATGVIHFSMVGLSENRQNVATRLRAEAYSEPAIPPMTPWLSGPTPSSPQILAATFKTDSGEQQLRLSWRSVSHGPAIARWIVQTKQGGTWTTRILGPQTRTLDLPEASDELAVQAVIITPVSRLGRAGLPTARVRQTPPVVR